MGGETRPISYVVGVNDRASHVNMEMFELINSDQWELNDWGGSSNRGI